MTTPRIFDEITRPGATWFDSGSQRVTAVIPEFADAVRKSVRVVADEITAWYFGSDKDVWDPRSDDFGPIRLPFPTLWIEGRYPELMHADGHYDRPMMDSVGFFLMEGRIPGAPEDGSTRFATLSVRMDRSGIVHRSPVTGITTTDASGRFTGTEQVTFDDAVLRRLTDDPQGYVNATCAENRSAMLALSMMNCKNIGLTHHAQTVRAAKKTRRARVAKLEYHTIKLPAARDSSRSAMSSALGSPVALHKVRGHFKTYTPEAPLLGQHVGTFWWGWHARGNKGNGIVVSDYAVGR